MFGVGTVHGKKGLRNYALSLLRHIKQLSLCKKNEISEQKIREANH